MDHIVNRPEIGRASKPIRIQLMVFGGDEEDQDIIILPNSLPLLVLGFLLGGG